MGRRSPLCRWELPVEGRRGELPRKLKRPALSRGDVGPRKLLRGDVGPPVSETSRRGDVGPPVFENYTYI